MRKTLLSVELRRAARKPWRRLNLSSRTTTVAPGAVAQRPEDVVVILD